MSFQFQWGPFSPEMKEKMRSMMEEALNKGTKPAVISDTIYVKELYLGTKAPELELLEIDELSDGKFSGIFKFIYNGDFHVVLQTKVQANPIQLSLPRGGIVAANKEMICPMELRIHHFRLRGIITLVVSKMRGVTLAFKNDPLEAVQVSSSFDGIQSTRRFLQTMIEGQVRNLFIEVLPKIVHSVSLANKKKAEKGNGNGNGNGNGKEDHSQPQSTNVSDDDASPDVDPSESSPSTPTASRRSSLSDYHGNLGADMRERAREREKEKVVMTPNGVTSQMARLVTMNSTLFPYENKGPISASATHRTCPPSNKQRRWRPKPVKRSLFQTKPPPVPLLSPPSSSSHLSPSRPSPFASSPSRPSPFASSPSASLLSRSK